MLPDPLHPAVVHFPVVLAFLLPISAVIAIWTIRRGAQVRRAWAVPLALAAALAFSSWIAAETGESEEDRVERVVAEAPLEAHEESAEAFVTGSALILLLTATGFAKGLVGRVGRMSAVVGATALLVGAAYVGHTGGELVYRHGAASAYAPSGVGAPAGPRGSISLSGEEGDEHDRD